jgi:hypothetical protein
MKKEERNFLKFLEETSELRIFNSVINFGHQDFTNNIEVASTSEIDQFIKIANRESNLRYADFLSSINQSDSQILKSKIRIIEELFHDVFAFEYLYAFQLDSAEAKNILSRSLRIKTNKTLEKGRFYSFSISQILGFKYFVLNKELLVFKQFQKYWTDDFKKFFHEVHDKVGSNTENKIDSSAAILMSYFIQKFNKLKKIVHGKLQCNYLRSKDDGVADIDIVDLWYKRIHRKIKTIKDKNRSEFKADIIFQNSNGTYLMWLGDEYLYQIIEKGVLSKSFHPLNKRSKDILEKYMNHDSGKTNFILDSNTNDSTILDWAPPLLGRKDLIKFFKII